ncbi:MAG TPA: hypothetical protein VMI54_19085 [Polyangiaceae bacterium]|nr:hypothetical protein [Polyangiaceae bacterium]
MARERDAPREPRGKILLFRRLRSSRSNGASDSDELDPEDAARVRRALIALWFTRAWIVAAWLLAALRVHRAAVTREVFGAEASIAFLVAVAIPLWRVRVVASVVGEVARAFRRRRPHPGGPPDPKSHAA